MGDANTTLPIGQAVSLPGHFDVPVILEAARPLAKGYECRVRLPGGTLDEAVITQEEAAALNGTAFNSGEMANISFSAELSALGKSTAYWQSIVEDVTLTAGEKEKNGRARNN